MKEIEEMLITMKASIRAFNCFTLKEKYDDHKVRYDLIHAESLGTYHAIPGKHLQAYSSTFLSSFLVV